MPSSRIRAQPVDEFAHVLEQRLELGLVHAAPEHAANLVGPAAPRHARQDDREQRGRAREDGEGADQQTLELPLAGLRKATVVEEHQEANRLATLGYRQGAQIEVVVALRYAVPRAPPIAKSGSSSPRSRARATTPRVAPPATRWLPPHGRRRECTPPPPRGARRA